MMLEQWLFFITICLVFVSPEELGSSTSTSQMVQLVTTEDQLLQAAREYVSKEEQRITEIKNTIKEFEAERGNASRNSLSYVSHPVQSLQLLRRLRRGWVSMKESITRDTNHKAYLDRVSTLEDSESYPSDEDYNDGARTILTLQDAYKLNTSLLADGVITERQPKVSPLQGEDCYSLALVARDTTLGGDYVRQWMEEALVRFQGDSKNNVSKIDVLHQISATLFKEGSVSKAIAAADRILEIDPNDKAAFSRKTVYEANLNSEMTSVGLPDTTSKAADAQEVAMALCRDDQQYMENIWRQQFEHLPKKPLLYCHVTHYNRPQLLIRPARVEVLNKKPPIVQFHDIITEKEMEKLTKFAKPHLQQSKVVVESSNTDDSTCQLKKGQRTSSIAWLNLRTSATMRKLLTRVEDYTGLSTKENHTEQVQACHYGLGGFYKCHYDDQSDEDGEGYRGMGNRIATVLFYLSDVEEGGATVFPRAGIRASPIKGSAIFWYNFLKNGKKDPNSLHAGCPVLVGTKWAANLWILENGQLFRRKCGLTPNEIY